MKILLFCVVALVAFFIAWQFTSWSKTSPVSIEGPAVTNEVSEITLSEIPNKFDEVGIQVAEVARLPLQGSAPTANVPHSIPLEEIRQGCFRQDCIPSVDKPEFVTVKQADQILPDDTIGIALSYKGTDRFYPFNMLVTREIVNEVIDGDPLLVTYCPLCGTGIVFERSINGEVFEFGVSGMLWQSNLLMYSRAEDLEDRNLWSQVLGKAVVGKDAGTQLRVVPSDIQQYITWRSENPGGEVLNTGRIGDPYNGAYYEVARNFAPTFDEVTSELDPSAYVYGLEIGDTQRAYPRDVIPEGESQDELGGETITIKREGETVLFIGSDGQLADIEGFWFSWKAAHPDTSIWQP